MECLLPIGPYHPVLSEPEYFKIRVEDGRVVEVDFRVGYNHRGIEKILEGRTGQGVVPIVERICGICNFAHTTCFCNAVERIAGVKPPERADWMRTLTAELERVQSHLLWLGLYADAMGFETLFMHIWKEREGVMRIFEEAFGNRVTKGLNTLGGVRWDIKNEGKIRGVAERIMRYSDELEKEFSSRLVKSRLEGVGVLERKDAKRLSLVGPVARASGIKFDIRRIMPYNAYRELRPEIYTEKDGDCLARVRVRIFEVRESCRLVLECLEGMPEGKLKTGLEFRDGETVGRVEAPRGENLHFVSIKEGRIARVRVRPPTFANFSAVPYMLLGERTADIPVVILSIDPCFSCMDRIAVYNERGERICRF